MSENNSHDDDTQLFKSLMSDVTQLSHDKIAPKPAPKTLKKQMPEPLISPAAKREGVFENDSFFAFHTSKKMRKAMLAGHLEWDAMLDLHGFTIAQSERLINQFIRDCQHQQIKAAIIVHGQGHHSKHGAMLKPAVQHHLSLHSAIDAYCPAQTRDGGKGASYILVNLE